MYSQFDFGIWVTPYGLTFLAAIVVAWFFARRNATSVNIDGSHIDLLMPITIIAGVAGGMALSLLMPLDTMVAGEMMQTGVRVRLFGLLATGAIALFIYSRIVVLRFRRLLDVFALPTLAGLMIHRFGCYLAGCCWGDLVSNEHSTAFGSQVQTLPFLSGLSDGVRYPPGSLPYEQHLAMDLIEPGALASLPVYPVQLYEAALIFAALLALWRVPWRRLPVGVLTILAVLAYSIIRFLLEYLRADGHIILGNLTVTQLQCLFLMLSVVLLRNANRDRHTRPR